MDISVIIVNYNTTDHLTVCINSILKFTAYLQFEIIVVDNNSADKYIHQLPGKFPEVKFFFNNENKGFGAGCNIGIRNSSGKYLAFVNPDIIFTDNSLKKFFDFMENHEEAGACGGLLTDFEGLPVYTYNYFPDFYWEFLQAIGKGTDYVIDKLNKKLKRHANAFEVDWLIGAFLFVRKNFLHEAVNFDEEFFLYYEDVDIQYRIRKMGKKIYCLPDINLKHFRQSSVRTSHGENIYFFHMTRSKILYMYKHFGFIKRNTIRIMYLMGISMRVITLPLRIKFRGQKKQKISQYIKMLSLFIKPRKKVLISTL